MESATFRKWLADRGCRFDHGHEKRGEGPVGGRRKFLSADLARSLTLALYAASARNLALTGPSCPGRKPACEASVAIALVLLKPGNFCRALAVKLP
jgi:hypothetical protein